MMLRISATYVIINTVQVRRAIFRENALSLPPHGSSMLEYLKGVYTASLKAAVFDTEQRGEKIFNSRTCVLPRGSLL